MDKRDDKSHIYKHRSETIGHMSNFGQVEVLDTEYLEGPKKIVEAVHTNFRRGTINIAAAVLNC